MMLILTPYIRHKVICMLIFKCLFTCALYKKQDRGNICSVSCCIAPFIIIMAIWLVPELEEAGLVQTGASDVLAKYP